MSPPSNNSFCGLHAKMVGSHLNDNTPLKYEKSETGKIGKTKIKNVKLSYFVLTDT
jgi:hypothetical protein